MNETFDMSVDYEVLCDMEAHLERIDYDLIQSIQSMAGAIRDSSEYLSGYQFEKAKRTTETCISLAKKTEKNIRHAISYLKEIQEVLYEYRLYAYSGEQI